MEEDEKVSWAEAVRDVGCAIIAALTFLGWLLGDEIIELLK